MESAVTNRWWLVVAASLAVFVAQLDATIVTIALPRMSAALGIGPDLIQWVALGYLLPLIALSLGAGQWVNGADPRRALIWSVTGFALASLVAGLAPGVGWLIAARVVQGGFAAIMLALAPVLTTRAVAPLARGRAFGIVMLLGPLGAMSGALVGGLLLEWFTWPWIFAINVPVAAIIIGLGRCQLEPGPRLTWPAWALLVEAGTIGAAALAILLGASLVIAGDPAGALVAVLAVPLVTLWMRLPGSAAVRAVVGRPAVLGSIGILLLMYAGVLAVNFVLPFVLQETLLRSPAVTGLYLLAFPAATSLTALVAGALADRFGKLPVAMAGAGIGIVGLLPIAGYRADWSIWGLLGGLIALGTGFGAMNGQVQVIAMNNTASDSLGTTSGATNLARQLGISAGSALGAAAWIASGDLGGLRLAAGVAIGLLLVTLAIFARLRTRVDPRPTLERSAAST